MSGWLKAQGAQGAQHREAASLRANGESLWRVADVAEYLRASRSWVYTKAEAGVLPCRRIEGLLRFVPSEVREFASGGVRIRKGAQDGER